MFLLLKILKLIIVWVFYHEIALRKLFLLLLMYLHSYSSLLVLSIFASFTVFPHFHACLVFFFIDIEKYHIWNLREPYFSTTFMMDNFRWICLTLPTEMSQFLSFFISKEREASVTVDWRRENIPFATVGKVIINFLTFCYSLMCTWKARHVTDCC